RRDQLLDVRGPAATSGGLPPMRPAGGRGQPLARAQQTADVLQRRRLPPCAHGACATQQEGRRFRAPPPCPPKGSIADSTMNELSQRAADLASMRHGVLLAALRQALQDSPTLFTWVAAGDTPRNPHGAASNTPATRPQLRLEADGLARAVSQSAWP